MGFGLFLSSVYNFVRVCPKQGLNLSGKGCVCTIVVVKVFSDPRSETFAGLEH